MLCVTRLQLSNIGNVILEYSWHIEMTNGPPVDESVTSDDTDTNTTSMLSLITGSAVTINKSSVIQSLVINPSALSATQSQVSAAVSADDVVDCLATEQNILKGELTTVTSQTGVVVLPRNCCVECLPYIPFTAVPQSGSILPGSSSEIVIEFAPLDVELYYAKLTGW